MKRKALIFYISKFSGHYHAASAIERGLIAMDPDIDIRKINALGYTNPILGSIINKAYLQVIKKKPDIWGHIYDNPDFMQKSQKAREALHKFNMSKIRKLIDSYAPDIIYCTQAFPCGLAADYKRSCRKDIPLVGVLTDHAPHSYWLYDEVDHYVVPSGQTAAALEAKGVQGSRIKVYGIPVDPRFMRKHDKATMLANLGLDPEAPTVLIMGGSQGLGAIEEAVNSIQKESSGLCQTIIVTGSNRKLHSKLKRMEDPGKSNSIRVLSFVTNIDELMDGADIIVTKAGGMTTAEALVKGLPLIILKPIPGHERFNADFFVDQGVAVEVKDCGDLPGVVLGLIENADKLREMSERALRLAYPRSATDIAELAFR